MTFFDSSDARIASSNTRISNPRVAGSNPAAPTIFPQVSEVIDPSRPKPVVSVGYNPQRAQISDLLNSIDLIADKKLRRAVELRLRDLVKSFRFPEQGRSIWAPLVFASAAMVVFALAVAQHTRHVYFYSYPENYLRVIQNLDPCQSDGSCGYRFVMQAVSDGVAAPETEMHFCKGLQPRFEAGHTLSWIRYVNLGSCQAIDGYDVLRDAQRLPILAGNCKFDWPHNHIACEGGRANFEVNQKGANEHRPNTATNTGDSSETSTNAR